MIHPYIDKIVLFGPFIGDWKEEIVSFRPYVNWIHDNVEFADYYVSSHFNRKFLYDFIKEENFIPIFEYLTREEHKQKNNLHKDIETKEYNSIILRKTRESIYESTNYLKKDIVQYGLSYTKSPSNFSVLNKKFSKIPYNKDKNKEKIVFIPDKSGNKKILNHIISYLEENYKEDFVIIGDGKCKFEEKNIINQRIDYFEIVYETLIDYISNAKLVICPCSHWTILANQQGSNVLSWGYDNLSKYKKNGTFGFNNENTIIEINKNVFKNKIIKQIDYAIENL